jgi:predicted nucleotidyltransferase
MMNQLDQQTEKAARSFLRRITGQYDISQIIVYGSRARGTHKETSDADVAVLINGTQQDFVSVKLQMADHAFDVLLETGVLISPMPIWMEEWNHPEDYSNPHLLRNIDKEGIRL